KAGKSRSAFEAAIRMEPEHVLLVPTSPGTLVEFLALDPPLDVGPRSAVLWLDDAERYLTRPDLQHWMLEKLRERRPRITVLGTMTLTQHKAVTTADPKAGQSEATRAAREILELATEVYLPSQTSPAELRLAESAYPGERFEAGIGEHFAAARELI